MLTGTQIDKSLRQGVRAFCAICVLASATLQLFTPRTSTAVTWTVIALASTFSVFGGPATKTAPDERIARLIAAAHAIYLQLAASLLTPGWNPLLRVAALVAFGRGPITLMSYLPGDPGNVALWSFFNVANRFFAFLGERARASTGVQHPVGRLVAVVAAWVPFAVVLSLATVWGAVHDAPSQDWPRLRAWARERRLRVRTWTARSLEGPRYSHTPISEEPSSDEDVVGRIRLIKLLPRWPMGDIRCELVEVELGSPSCPPYEAVSYHWGSGLPTEPIQIDGRVFLVSPTVFAALYHLSKHRYNPLGPQARHLWIDSICINQRDTAEKCAQITLMAEIYRRAGTVIIWLDHLPEPWEAAKTLAGLWHEFRNGTPESGVLLMRKVMERDREAGWDQLAAVFSHPWFFRVWVIQEVTSQGDTEAVKVLTSTTVLSWSHIVQVAECLNSAPYNMAVQTAVVDPRVNARYPQGLLHATVMRHLGTVGRKNSARQLPFLLAILQSFSATDPRDQIYALLGLLDPEDEVHSWLKPDYNRTVEDLYNSVARGLMSASSDGAQSCNILLSFAGIGYDRELGASLASWAVDWTSVGLSATGMGSAYRQHMERSSLSSQFDACAGCPVEVSFVGAEMRIVARIFDRIRDIGPMMTYSEQHPELLDDDAASSARVVLSHLQTRQLILQKAKRPYPTGQPLHEVCWRSLLGDTQFQRPAPAHLGEACREWEAMMIWEMFKGRAAPAVGEALALVGALLQEEAEDDEEGGGSRRWEFEFSDEKLRKALEWNGARIMCCTGRVGCVTDRGYVAMAPPLTRPGDLVCVLDGLKTPFVLREVEGGGGRMMRLVGEAYVHGIMDGEVIYMGREATMLVVV